jgi:membrane protein YqaA with SNARE-associated domain
MNISSLKKDKLKWRSILLLASLVLAISFLLLKLLPGFHELIFFGMYSIPSQMLISIFPHEPALLYTAKFYSPTAITIAGTIGCCIAGVFDYWLLIPLMNHEVVRPKFENKPLFKKALAFFQKSPFWLLAIAAYIPVPFYPFKFLSIAGKYPLRKYQAALIVGRAPRYFTLAVLGFVLQPPTWILIALFAVLILMPVASKLFGGIKNKKAAPENRVEETSVDESNLVLNEYRNLISVDGPIEHPVGE